MFNRNINWRQIKVAPKPGLIAHSDDLNFRSMRVHFQVPLAHNDPKCTKTIQLHAELVYGDGKSLKHDLSIDGLIKALGPLTSPLTVYLCGGPGSDNPAFASPGLTKLLLDRIGTPVLYLSYRGTWPKKDDGKLLENRITAATFAGLKPEQAAQRLMLYLQDSIVADFEAVRLYLNKLCNKDIKFALVGQSYGGWIAMTYLSFLPESLARGWLAGGMPPVGKKPDEVYTALYKRVVKRNEKYYENYPEDVGRVWEIVQFLAGLNDGKGIKLPDGQWLSARGFLTMGRHFGSSEGFRKVHALVESFDRHDKQYYGFENVEMVFRLRERPLYAVLHEAIYCYGVGVVPDWAAQRIGMGQPGGHYAWVNKEFQFKYDASKAPPALYFSGEMIFDFMLRDAGEDQNAFVAASEMLAQYKDWPELYDVNALESNTVPLTALMYPEDMFVDYTLSEKAAGMVKNCEPLKAPDDWAHADLKSNPVAVGAKLFALK